MKAKVLTKFLAPMILLLGTALPAWGQQPSRTFQGFGCRIDLTAVARVPAQFRAVLLTTDTVKNCPNDAGVPAPVIQMVCNLLIPGWNPSVKINTKTHACEIDAEQCGRSQVFVGDSVHLLIEPVVINGEVFGDAELRCLNKNKT